MWGPWHVKCLMATRYLTKLNSLGRYEVKWLMGAQFIASPVLSDVEFEAKVHVRCV